MSQNRGAISRQRRLEFESLESRLYLSGPPTIIITTDDSEAQWPDDPATVSIVRTGGDPDTTLPITFDVGGSANHNDYDSGQLDIDFDTNTGWVTLLPGEVQKDVIITAVRQSQNVDRSLILEIVNEPLYVVGQDDSVTITIKGNDPVPNAALISGTITYDAPQSVFNGSVTAWFKAPLRGAKIEVWEDSDTVPLATTWTDALGFYEATVDADDGLIGEAEIYIKVITESRPQNMIKTAYKVVNGEENDALIKIDSAIHDVVAGESQTINMSIDDDQTKLNRVGIQVFDALRDFAEYHAGLPNSTAATATVRVNPAGGQTRMNFAQQIIEIDALNRWVRDTIGEEFGHWVQWKEGWDVSSGGLHHPADNVRTRTAIETAMRRAFIEGWAKYFSVMATSSPGSNIATVGDTKYTYPQGEYDLASEVTTNFILPTRASHSLGEDNELSVARVLWNLDDGDGDDVHLGTTKLWNTVSDEAFKSDPTLFRLWDTLTEDLETEERLKYGKIFSHHYVNSSPLKTTLNGMELQGFAENEIPTFTFSAPYGVHVGANANNGIQDVKLFDDLTLFFYDGAYNRIDLSPPPIIVLPAAPPNPLEFTWTPSGAEWFEIVTAARNADENRGIVHWTVFGHLDQGLDWISSYESGENTFEIVNRAPALNNQGNLNVQMPQSQVSSQQSSMVPVSNLLGSASDPDDGALGLAGVAVVSIDASQVTIEYRSSVNDTFQPLVQADEQNAVAISAEGEIRVTPIGDDAFVGNWGEILELVAVDGVFEDWGQTVDVSERGGSTAFSQEIAEVDLIVTPGVDEPQVVDTVSAGTLQAPAVALDSSGESVISWSGQGSQGWGSYAHVFASDGQPVGGEIFVANSGSAGADFFDLEGSFVVASDHGTSVRLQRYSSSGDPLGDVQWTTPFGVAAAPSIVVDDVTGQGVVAWSEYQANGEATSVYAQRLHADGTADGERIELNGEAGAVSLWNPVVAMQPGGGFTAAWIEDYGEGSGRWIVVQQFDDAGVPVGMGQWIAGDVGQWFSLAVNSNGDSVILWETQPLIHNSNEIRGQRMAADGSLGNDFFVAYSFDGLRHPAVALDDYGRFGAAWEVLDENGTSLGSEALSSSGIKQRRLTRTHGRSACGRCALDASLAICM